MAIAIDSSSRLSIILKSDQDKPAKDQTTFYMKPMTASVMQKFMSKFGNRDEGSFQFDEIADILCNSLLGWTNFKNGVGKDVEFKKVQGKCDPSNLEYFSVNQVIELLSSYMEENKLGSVTEKN